MRRPRHRQLRMLTVFLVVIALFTAASIVLGPGPAGEDLAIAPAAATTTPPPATPPPTTPLVATSSPVEATTTAPLQTKDVAEIQQEVGRAVAFITTFNGTGSGVLVGDGLVATNAHVVWPFGTVGVLFPGDSRRTGRVIGIDARADLAFLQIDSPRLPMPLELGSASSLVAGAQLYVVGYPGVEEFTPDPTVDGGAFSAIRPWAFSGADWVATEAPAIGGQSGGALVDEYGRLVGITTFGSPATLYSISVEDVQTRIAAVDAAELSDLADRAPPRTGGRRSHEIDLEGPWEQVAFLAWLSPGARSEVESSSDVLWRALDPFGVELATGHGSLDVVWFSPTPGVVLAEATGAGGTVTSDVESTRPLVLLEDPDDARAIRIGDDLAGFVDVPGDRDWFYLELDQPVARATIGVEAQTRVRISLYDRTTLALIAEVVHERGFFFEDPPLAVGDLPAGSYVVAVEDIAAQFGTYRVSVDVEPAR